MLSFSQANRAYSAINAILEGGPSPYLKTAVVASQKHPVSLAFAKLESQSVTYFCYSSIRPWQGLCFAIDKIMVDGQAVLEMIKKDGHWIMNVNEEIIRSLAKPAPFGKGSETLIDETVRKALEISADRVEVKTDRFEWSDMIGKLQTVAPRGKMLVPKLYKLHIYEEGGMFVKHKDTLHAPNHYATLIVGLPTEYTGGEFVLELPSGEEQRFDLKYLNSNRFLVFLTDMTHQVMKVEKGLRAVLQYDVYLESDNYEYEEEPETPHKKFKADAEIGNENIDNYSDNMGDDEVPLKPLDDKSSYQKGLARQLNFDPPDSAVAKQAQQDLIVALDDFLERHPNDHTKFDHLKAGDRSLYEILSEKYHLSLGLVVNAFETDEEGDSKEHRSLHVMDYRCRLAFNEFSTENKFDPFQGYKRRVQGQADESYKSYVFRGKGAYFDQVKHKDIGYTGNEAASGEYVYASVVLSVGPRKN